MAHRNPYYQRGDFDGDGKTDFAVLCREKVDQQKTRLAILTGDKKVHWLDRDDLLQYPTLEAWHIVEKGETVYESPFANGDPPVLTGDALMIIKLESSSALVYWNGKRFVSYWQGD